MAFGHEGGICMLVKFNTKDSKVTDNVLQTMENKIQHRFKRYFAQEPEDATVFTVKIADKKYRYKVELTLPYMGYQLRTETYDDISALAALDKSMDTMERQISKCKTKLARNKYQTPEPVAEGVFFEEEPAEYEIVKTKVYEMKPLSVQEAILNMNMLGHNFYMFLNRDSNKISTVYRRDDKNYGLIEPL